MAPTPMMAQYLRIREEAGSALLFYRMGDFYELFFEDAEVAAQALDIALTKRGQHEGRDIPMCGVPVHSAEGYLQRLIRAGHRVAVCEQTEDPAEARKRGSKAVVNREIVRLVTPGTLTEDALLDARAENLLAAFHRVRDEGALAWVDISTGAFTVAEARDLPPLLARLAPVEVLVSTDFEAAMAETVETAGATLTPLAPSSFDSTEGEARTARLFGARDLGGFGSFTRAQIGAMGALADWLEITQRGALPLLRPPRLERSSGAMSIDAPTRRSLEIAEAQGGGRAGSLLEAVDRTATASGARLLARRLSAPSTEVAVIRARADAVEALAGDAATRERFRDALRAAPDLDRALSRLALNRGGPRDLAAIRGGLESALILEGVAPMDLPDLLRDALADLHDHNAVLNTLRSALVAEPPLLARDGGLVVEGADAELDEARALQHDGRSVIAGMQKDYAERTGIASLKVKHNNVLGYFVETTATHAEAMLARDDFIHRQTTASAVRFTTPELSELETRILNAAGRAQAIELRIFEQLRALVLDRAPALHATAAALAEIDLAAAFATLAVEGGWTRPLVDDSAAFAIEGGRHPVVERALRRGGTPFVANDCDLGGPRVILLTGPNMAGKSTFLRQNALICLLAQTGSYVPAAAAHIGTVDSLHSRVGASDDLAAGRSTFMVEMVETAAILNQAGPRALVILDEIGRGTATWDGLSIAWAVLEHLEGVNRCRAIFATHYHEMTALAAKLDGARNATVAVREWEGEVVFLHEVREGAADRSYGVQVARLAGLPASVVDRARRILETLENGERGARPAALIDDLPLFSNAPPPPPPAKRAGPAEERLDAVNPDALTPREALDLVYELKGLLSAPSGG
ncbi:DNA mismatch repair protein MutS [Hasllibacter halocynthiae]|uniref:DNA mismatch repair protein MutS n=1 Tax=Hasllibacter halocynthiae TaxID=595589 RepID=A0A2T0X2B6_9RHOB|nr:DNA mismatch repair protein MutS [Hasllibacter halocynthiae]PRY93081.1 DNA mismatch repair protein MutS [Hasllibacter halocynthiae]